MESCSPLPDQVAVSQEENRPKPTNGSKASPKIRASCDCCSVAKVRCSKETPSCARCRARRVPCVYGHSRRSGRPPRSRPGTSKSSHDGSPNPQSICLELLPQAKEDRGFELNDQTFAMSVGNVDIPHDIASISGASSLPPHLTTTFLSSGLGILPDQLWSPDSTMGSSIAESWNDFDFAHALNETSTNKVPIESLNVMGTDQHCRITPAFGNGGCMAILLQALSTLYPPNESCTANANVAATNATTSKHIDAILNQNREAGYNLLNIAKCSCSRSASVAMICYVAASQMLWWYINALGLDDEELSHNAVPEAQPMCLGSFCIDADDQRPFLAHIVREEMHKYIAPLLSLLPRSDQLLVGASDELQKSFVQAMRHIRKILVGSPDISL